jgi:tRNA dimethylallyltransferase
MEKLEFLAIVGPTASGKTGLSLKVGARLDAEIISMDSRQIYRGMDIGTGKVTLRERGEIPHHGLDLRDPDEFYSAGQFSRDAREWIQDIKARGRIPILVGGTGFFLRALISPMFKEPPLDPTRVRALRVFLNDLSREELIGFLTRLDPPEPSEPEKDRQRLTRSVEVALMTGRPLSWWHSQIDADQEPLSGLVVLLDPPRDALYGTINERVGEMVGEGLVQEVRRLLEAGYGAEDPGMTGAGYREIIRYLQGGITLEEATDEIRRSHRRYARRQTTWFRHQLPQDTVTLDGMTPREERVERVLEAWYEAKEGAVR